MYEDLEHPTIPSGADYKVDHFTAIRSDIEPLDEPDTVPQGVKAISDREVLLCTLRPRNRHTTTVLPKPADR